jgi:acetylornithine deacetylase/succinyl-diaminopimelate desuccinylase family protein
VSQAAGSAAAGPADAGLLGWLEAWSDEALDFARALIATPSPNPPGDQKAVADLVVRQLHDLGITDITIVAAEPTRPNVIARVGRTSGRSLILNGHLDTKPPGDVNSWRTDPWDPQISDGRLYGLGSADMKAAVAAMTYAAGALAAHELPGELTLVFSVDEEAPGMGARWLAEGGHLRADAAVIGEPSGITREWESLHLVSRGVLLFRVRVTGTQMHSSISDRLPCINASVMMARLIERMDSRLKQSLRWPAHPLAPSGPTVNVGVMVSGGVYYGVNPGSAEFACDLRTLPGMTQEDVEADIRGFIDEAGREDPDLHAELIVDAWLPATEIPADHPIVAELLEAAQDVLGHQPRLDVFPGATDAAHFQLGAGIPTVAAFGPGLLPLAHSPNESVEADSVRQAAQIYALAARRYLAGV